MDAMHHTRMPLRNSRARRAQSLSSLGRVPPVLSEVQAHAAHAARQALIRRSEVLSLLEASDLSERGQEPMASTLDELVGEEGERETLAVLPFSAVAAAASLRTPSAWSTCEEQD